MATRIAIQGRKNRQLATRVGAANLVVDFGGRRRTSTPMSFPVAGGRQFPEPGFTGGGGGALPGPTGGTSSFDPFNPDTWPDFIPRNFTQPCENFSSGSVLRQACEAVKGALTGGGGGGGSEPLAPPTGPGTRPAGDGPCREGTIRVMGQCVAIGDAFPGGDPLFTPAGGGAVAGSFGLPAITPTIQQRTRRECPSGMVLGKDNLCYPKQILSRRSKFRKWKAPKRPPISVRDANAIRRAERAKSRVKSLAKDVGFSVKKR